jgi:hypothetical protein
MKLTNHHHLVMLHKTFKILSMCIVSTLGLSLSFCLGTLYTYSLIVHSELITFPCINLMCLIYVVGNSGRLSRETIPSSLPLTLHDHCTALHSRRVALARSCRPQITPFSDDCCVADRVAYFLNLSVCA